MLNFGIVLLEIIFRVGFVSLGLVCVVFFASKAFKTVEKKD